jgi:hypothetical protein
MRHTILSRSAIAVASLAVGSAAFAAVPASAASALGVTQDQVLTAVNGVRTANATNANLSKSTQRALFAITSRACDVDGELGEYLYVRNAVPTTAGDDADGLLITAELYGSTTGDNDQACTFAAFASAAGGFQLSGTATITAETTVFDEALDQYVTSPYKQVSSLSGDAFTTPAIVTPENTSNGQPTSVVASAAGNATKTTTTSTNVKVKDKKSTKEKKAAKQKYSKRLAQAKKNYAKALDKAGSSKSKKAAAKRVYAKARALAKAKYKYATAGYKIVKKKSTISDARPFSITTQTPAVPPVVND